MKANDRMTIIRERLQQHFAPSHLELIDDGDKHIGHPGAQHGGHFTVKIASESLNKQSTVAAHQAIYNALGELMKTDIHALSIQIIKPYA